MHITPICSYVLGRDMMISLLRKQLLSTLPFPHAKYCISRANIPFALVFVQATELLPLPHQPNACTIHVVSSLEEPAAPPIYFLSSFYSPQ